MIDCAYMLYRLSQSPVKLIVKILVKMSVLVGSKHPSFMGCKEQDSGNLRLIDLVLRRYRAARFVVTRCCLLS